LKPLTRKQLEMAHPDREFYHASEADFEIESLRLHIDKRDATIKNLEHVEHEMHRLDKEVNRTCIWERQDDGYYDTECDNAWVFNDGTYKDNKAEYCMFCGGKIVE